MLCFVDASPSPSAPGEHPEGSEVDKVAAWDAGEVGGFEAYLLAEEDKEGAAAADTYRAVRSVFKFK